MSRFGQLPAQTQKLAAVAIAALLIAAGAGLSWMLHGNVADARARLDASVASEQAMRTLVQRFEARQASGAACKGKVSSRA
jgi:hypothetical protein